ncbi:hypothetical protein CVD25_08370 [Bacillus canaveralius]|uniref:Glycosyltransferase family 1 protein n=1 Tax=Bacillus canaveralius TaxID=1403243 RepID=A0A2N5GID1_9BACI|nr:hypothetical protein CU635_17000 [Bacillus canaveralius]PLR98373.1 hypothetical protein CVD25_08370 [Bacillus canaveralius]
MTNSNSKNCIISQSYDRINDCLRGVKLNIAFDTFYTSSASNFRGIGDYTRNMIENIMRLNKTHSIFFFSPDPYQDTSIQINKLQSFLTNNSIDLYHVTSPVEYLFNHNELLNREWFGDVKLAVTFYDVIPLIYPEIYLSDPIVKNKFLYIMDFIKNCDTIFAISETTKKDGVKYFDMDSEKISVVYGGIDRQFFQINKDSDVKLNNQVNQPYILFIGGMEFRKNLERVLHAFAIINHKLETQYQFVMTGFFSEVEKQKILQLAAAQGIENQLIYTGYVPKAELINLYSNSSLFIFPSLYEGLGLPIIEAMACGAPVLTSNTSALNEIANDACYKVNPESIEEISEGIYNMLTKSKLLERYKQEGPKLAAKFNWENVASQILSCYTDMYVN